MTTKLKILFAGTPEFGVPSLEALFQSEHEIIGVYTQPDRPSGRGQKLLFSPVKEWAIAHEIPVFQPLNFKEEQSVETLKSLHADLMVVIAYGLILPLPVLTAPRLGCINVHASLLPRYRGASPIQQALLHGDTESGVTIMQMEQGLDTGPMLMQASLRLGVGETAGSLHDKLAQLAITPLLQTVDALAKGTAHPLIQDDAQATYAGKIKKEQALIDWDQSAHQIERQIRAFQPWPVAFTHYETDSIRIYEAEIIAQNTEHSPGTILSVNKTGILVAAQQDALLIKKIQFSGGKPLRVADWLNAHQGQIQPGQVLQ